jgi:hypothetical protein
MPDVVTREERALIDAALANTPRAKRHVPAGRSGLPLILWDGEQLRTQGITNGWKGIQTLRAKGARAAGIAAQSRVAGRNAQICEDARLGLTYAQLVEKYELSKPSIYEIVARSGGRVAPCAQVFSQCADLTARIAALADGVRTITDIAQAAKCSPHSVRMRRDQLGLDIPFGKSGPKVSSRKDAVCLSK